MTDTRYAPSEARHVLIGVNSHAGAENRQAIVTEFCRQLASQSFECTVFNEIDALAREAERLLSAGRLRAVVAAGGDGTIRLIAERNH